MANKVADFNIASGETTSNGHEGHGLQLLGLSVPTLDSAAIEFEVSVDGGTTWRDLTDDTGSAVTLGSEDTGDKYVPMPSAVRHASMVAQIRIVLGAAQTGGARTIVGMYGRLGDG